MNLENMDFDKMADEFTNMIVDYTPVAYVIMDKEYNILYTNNYVLDITGYKKEDLVGLKCFDVINKGVACKHCAVRKTFLSNKRETILKEELDKAGNEIYNQMISVPIIKADGSYDYIMEIVIAKTDEVLLRKKIERDFVKLVEMLSSVLGTRDEYTGTHSENVKKISMIIAEQLEISEKEKEKLFIAASLHDIGKIGISDSVLNKNGKLTDEEYKLIQSHPVLGEQILKNIESFGEIKDIVKYHHERYDGKGYPDGLKGDEIPFLSRIISIADTFDAMTTTRPYRTALDNTYAKSELIKYRGTQFDPFLADIFVGLIDNGLV